MRGEMSMDGKHWKRIQIDVKVWASHDDDDDHGDPMLATAGSVA